MNSNKTNQILINILEQIEEIPKAKNNKKIYDPFDTEESDTDTEPEIIQPTPFARVLCTGCQSELSISNGKYECLKCGLIEEYFGNDIDSIEITETSYNTSESSVNPIQISGPNYHKYQKKLISTTSNYKKTQKKNTEEQIEDIIYQHKGSKPHKSIILEAAELYYKIQQYCIKRGDVRKGTMAACLYKICDLHNITRKPKEIADIFNIPQNELSNGQKILDNLISQGLIQFKEVIIDPEEKRMQSFLNMYFEALKIPTDPENETFPERPNYKDFSVKLIRFTEIKRIAKSSIMSSKCAGTIHILSVKRKELKINKDMIEKECNISRSTFSRFNKDLEKIIKNPDDPNHLELLNIYRLLDK